MSGIICVHIGGYGIALGDTFYEVISHEHGLTPAGKYVGNSLIQLQKLGVYYSIGNRIYAKAVLVDTDEATFSKNYCSRPYGEMFSYDNVIFGKSGGGTGNNYAKGYNTEGKELLYPTLDAIRHEAELSDCLQGLQLCHAIGGGTGSGFSSLLLENLVDEYPSQMICCYTVMPSTKFSNVVVEPYNAMLSLRYLTANAHLDIMVDSEALYNIGNNLLKGHQNLADLHYIVAHTMSGITTSLRFPGQLNSGLRKIYTNMCPFPNLHFLAPGFSPIMSIGNLPYAKINTEKLIYDIFASKNFLSSVDLRNQKILTLAAIFRGSFSPKDITSKILKSKQKFGNSFCSWVPNNIQWAICGVAPKLLPKSVSFLANTSAIRSTMESIRKSARNMLKKKAYLHWYTGEGLEVAEFNEALENLVNIIAEYESIAAEEQNTDNSSQD